jgi:hypothetical protein
MKTEIYLKIKGDEDLEKVIAKGKEHLLESLNKDLMTVDELLAYTLDFIDKVDDLQYEIDELKDTHEQELEYAKERKSTFVNRMESRF